MENSKRTSRKYIVCVDDDRALLDGLMQQLEEGFSDTHEIEGAESALEALDLIHRVFQQGDNVEMVIADQVMPNMKGDALLERLHKQYPEMLTVMLTGQGGLDSAIHAINHAGLRKYFVKPWNKDDLKFSIQDLLEKYQLKQENMRLFHELQDAYDHLKTTQEQLIHSEKLAVVGKLTAGIAHEIRNQLTILGYAEIIKMSVPNNKEVAHYVQNILDTRGRILSIVDEIRQFARNQTQSYQKKPFALTNVVDTAMSLVNYDKEAKRRTITKDFQVAPVVMINRDKIIQVLINLLRNAVHATTGSDQITVVITTNQTHAIIDVSDTGCGITPEHLESIWRPFFTTKGEEGTGLGLDICRRIIDGHDGRIYCRSEVGAGTTFSIELPLDTAEREDQ